MSLIANPHDYVPIVSKGEHPNISRTVKIHKSQLPEWQNLKQHHRQNFQLLQAYRYIVHLGGIADQRDDKMHRISKDFAELTYRFDDHGDVYLQQMQLIKAAANTQQKAGIYDVGFGLDRRVGENKWLTDDDLQQAPKLTKELDGTQRIAVSGKPFENKEEAGELLSSHIINAYSIHREKTNAVGNLYSLVWLDKAFTSDKSVSLISDIIVGTAQKNAYLDWLVHSKACSTFTTVMKMLPGMAKANPQLAKALSKQRVYFSNPRGNVTKSELERLCKASGLSYQHTRIDPYDWRNADARVNIKNNFGVTVAKIGLGGSAAFFGVPEFTKYWQQLSGGPATLVGIAGVAATGLGLYMTKKGDVKQYGGYLKNSGKAWNSTFGKGHLRWD